MKKIFCALTTICMLAALLLTSVSASGDLLKVEDFDGFDVGYTNWGDTVDGSWEAQQEDTGNKYLNCQINNGQSHYNIYCDDMLEESVYLAFDIYLDDANYSSIDLYGTTDVGSNYTVWRYGYIQDGKLFNKDKSSSVDISTGEWHTIEFFFDMINETNYVYLDGQEVFSFAPYDGHVGDTAYTYVDHLRIHMKGDGRGDAVIKLDNFKLGTYDEIGETPTTEAVTEPIPTETTSKEPEPTEPESTTDAPTTPTETTDAPATGDITTDGQDDATSDSGMGTETIVMIVVAAVAVVAVVVLAVLKKKKA